MSLISLTGACTVAPDSDLDRLNGMPEISLVPTGAEQLATGGRETEEAITGTVPASTWAIYGTDAPADEILEFYAGELSVRGWTEGGGVSGIRGTHELDVAAWHKDGVVFRLGFWKLDEWRQSQEVGLEYQTIFEGSLIRELADDE